MNFRFAPSACGALLIAGLSSTALSQESESNSAAISGTLEEVVVTARKREENIQETPLAVTALSGAALKEAGIENVSELSKSVPSLQINKGQGNQIYIRGIGERSGFVRVDPTVGVYVDDLFLPRSDGQLLDTLDIQSLQVLRGPQGTLFGKNTTGGALVLSIAKPHEEFEGYVEGGIGNYGASHFRVGVNTPLSDDFYMRFSANSSRRDGFMKDGGGGRTNSADGMAAMLQTRWDASDRLSVDNLLFYGESHDVMTNTNCHLARDEALFASKGLGLLWPGDTDPANLQAYENNCENNSRENQGDLTADKGRNPMLNRDFYAFLLGTTARYEINDNYSVKAVVGIRKAKEGPIQTSDNDGGVGDWSEAYSSENSYRRSMSVELQLNGSLFDSRVNFSTGVFASKEDNNETFLLLTNLVGIDSVTALPLALQQLPPPSVIGTVPVIAALTGDPLLRSRFTLNNSTYAAYFQGSWDISEQLQLTLGARYTEETRQSDLENTGTDLDAAAAILTAADPRFVSLNAAQPGFFSFLGTWNDDPVAIAQAAFADTDGDGLVNYPYDEANPDNFYADEVFTQLTPMASLSYVFDEVWLDDTPLDTAMVYLTLSSGFKSGFSEPRGADGLARIEPEEVDNTELGFKIDAFDRSLRFNLAAYRTEYKNMQLITVSADTAGNLIVVFTNAGRSTITGAEMELSWLPFPGALITLNYSNNNYAYQEFTDTDLLSLSILGQEVPVDRSNEPFPAAPEESASLGIQFSIPTAIGIITPRLDVSYKSEIFFGLDATSAEVYREDPANAGADAYTLADFRVTWSNNNEDWRVAGFVKNLTDERYINSTVSVTDSLGTFNIGYGDPRTYGLQFTKTF